MLALTRKLAIEKKKGEYLEPENTERFTHLGIYGGKYFPNQLVVRLGSAAFRKIRSRATAAAVSRTRFPAREKKNSGFWIFISSDSQLLRKK